MRVTEDITLGETTFHKDDVIAVIEIKSTTDIDYFWNRFSVAKSDIKKHIGTDICKLLACDIVETVLDLGVYRSKLKKAKSEEVRNRI